MTVYVDLDGVLANFNSKALELFGDDWKSELELPNWGRFGEIHDLYATLDLMPDALELWDFLKNRYTQVEILTAIPRRAHLPNAVNHKREWVRRHLDKNVRVNFGPYAYDKQFHCRTISDILIDDMPINCEQWRNNEAVAILHTSAKDTISQLSKKHQDAMLTSMERVKLTKYY